jgi:prepilin-type N-terminal cleavage/methylation domain-containing protein
MKIPDIFALRSNSQAARKHSMKSKRSTQNSSSGFTLIELLVATLVSSAILTASLALINQQRRQVLGTQAQTQVKQNLRAAMDLIGADAKLAGERLENPADYQELPVISIDSNGAVVAGVQTDALTMQRKLIPDVLTVCADIAVGDRNVRVSDNPGAGNCLFSDGNGNSLTDTLDAFQAYRCSQDGVNACARTVNLAALAACDNECVWAYIHDPVENRGEFFRYVFEEADNVAAPTLNRIHVRPTGAGGNWQFSYATANAPKIYILEEKQFSLTNTGVLQLSINRQAATNLVNQLDDFQVRALVDGDNNPATASTWQTSFNPTLPPATVWQRIDRIQVSLQACDPSLTVCDAFGSSQAPVSLAKRQLTADFFPRNAISRPGV